MLNNLSKRLDGSGIFQQGYNRDFKISKNEFVWIGDNVIGSVGDVWDCYNPYVNKDIMDLTTKLSYVIYVMCCITSGASSNIFSRMTNTIINTKIMAMYTKSQPLL